MSDEPTDQPTQAIALVNGITSAITTANVQTLKNISPSSSVYIFTHNFTHSVGHQTVGFRKGVAYSLAPAIKTALLAVSAPMTAA